MRAMGMFFNSLETTFVIRSECQVVVNKCLKKATAEIRFLLSWPRQLPLPLPRPLPLPVPLPGIEMAIIHLTITVSQLENDIGTAHDAATDAEPLRQPLAVSLCLPCLCACLCLLLLYFSP